MECANFALLALLLLLPSATYTATGPIEEAQTSMLSVSGVAGQASRLPCPLTPRSSGDVPKLVLWYKSGDSAPIYSQDGRSKHEYGSKHHRKHLQNQAYSQHAEAKKNLYLTLSHHSATLTLRHTSPLSAGLYECRVDFFRSPSHTSFVNLTVIEPPVRLSVVDADGFEPRQGHLGPYTEGEPVTLSCTAHGGDPEPSVVWIRDGDMTIDESDEAASVGDTVNELAITRLTRDWSNSTLTCLASNSDLVSPLTVTFVLDVLLLPVRVSITGPSVGTAGSVLTFRCTSEGSDPPATLSWRVGGRVRPGETVQYGDAVSALLLLNVTSEDDGAEVECAASNPALPERPVRNSTNIVVQYPPAVTASLGPQLSLANIKEGDDVYFNCDVRANPPATKVIWYHEAEEQVQDLSSGVILSGEALVLQRVLRSRSGSYRCSARNALALTLSESVTLKIKYLPECQSRTVTYFIYSDPINVTCTYAAHPRLTRIWWHWNATSDVNNTKSVDRLQQISSEPVRGNGDLSTAQLTVYPSMSPDDRELTCRGVNELGNQTKSCKFFIKRAKMPAPLSSCRLANITASSLSLTCEHPDLPTETTIVYTAQVYFENGTLFANLSSPEPNFNVSHLDQGTNYQIKVYVSQGPITSPPVLVSASTSRESLRQTIRSQKTLSPSSVSLVAIALGVAVPLLLLVGVVLLRGRRPPCGGLASSPSGQSAQSYNEGDADGAAESEALRGDDVQQAQYFTNAGSSASLEELNPDVVPSREDNFDLLPNQTYYVRYPADRGSPPSAADEGRPMLPAASAAAADDGAQGDGDGRANEDFEDNESPRYTMGVTIGGVGQSVTSLFRSRSRPHNITSFLTRPGDDHETIV